MQIFKAVLGCLDERDLGRHGLLVELGDDPQQRRLVQVNLGAVDLFQ